MIVFDRQGEILTLESAYPHALEFCCATVAQQVAGEVPPAYGDQNFQFVFYAGIRHDLAETLNVSASQEGYNDFFDALMTRIDSKFGLGNIPRSGKFYPDMLEQNLTA